MASQSKASRTNPIIIVGGGFAGVTLAQKLEKKLPKAVEIVGIGSANHLVFTPMLPEVAARKISPLHVVAPNRQMTKRTRWIQGTVGKINTTNKTLAYHSARGIEETLSFSHLVLACGSAVNMDKIPGLASRGLTLKTVEDAMRMGNDFIGLFESASAEENPEERKRLLTTVVVGGGFSGTEIAGHLADFAREIHRFYPELKELDPKIILLQHGERILPELQHEALSSYANDKLTKNGVEIRLKTGLKEVSKTYVVPEPGDRIPCGMVVCTIGNDTVNLIKQSDFPQEKGRLKTKPDMRLEGQDDIFAIGDCALILNKETGEPSPATAQFALRQANQLAENLERIYTGTPTQPFSHKPQGLLAAIGHRNAVAEILGVKLSGFIAWFLWRGIYLVKLPGISRKIEVATAWLGDIIFKPNIVQLYAPTDSGDRKSIHYCEGDTVYETGATLDRLYVIQKGKAVAEMDDGTTIDLTRGSSFGLKSPNKRLATSKNQPARHTIRAKEALELIVL